MCEPLSVEGLKRDFANHECHDQIPRLAGRIIQLLESTGWPSPDGDFLFRGTLNFWVFGEGEHRAIEGFVR